MAITLSDLRTRLAYRLGENSAPGAIYETSRRDQYLNEGYRKVMSEEYWWFSETIGAQNTVASQEIYTLSSAVRDIIEVRQNRKVVKPMAKSDAFGTYNYPPLDYQYHSLIPKWYVYGQTELHILPIPDSTPSTLSVSGITQTGGTATVTTTTEHGLQANDFVLIAGATQSGYNGTVKILTAPTTTTFTYAVASATVSPATGTITAIWQNLVYRYWAYYTPLTATTDTILIPDQFADIVVAYAYGRYGYLADSKGNSEAGFAEYNEILKDLKREHNRRLYWGKSTPPTITDFEDS